MVLLVAKKKKKCYNVGKRTKSQNQKQVCEAKSPSLDIKVRGRPPTELGRQFLFYCQALAGYCLYDNEVPKDKMWGAHEATEPCQA